MDDHSPASQAGSVLTITDLIRAKLDTGKSVRDLARDSGGQVKYQTFQEYSVRSPKSWPKDRKTVTGMAQALDVTETAIVIGYAASLGIDVKTDSMLAQQLPAAASRLSPRMRNAIVGLITATYDDGIEHAEQDTQSRTQESSSEYGGASADPRLRGAPRVRSATRHGKSTESTGPVPHTPGFSEEETPNHQP